MKKTALIFALAFLSELLSLAAYGGQEGFFEFTADCNIQIIGEPKLHEAFEAVFTIIPQHDLIHTMGIPDTLTLKCSEGVKFIEGDTLWTGFLQRDKRYTLRARFVVDTTILFQIRGAATAMQAIGILAHPRGTEDMGVKASKRANSPYYDFTIHTKSIESNISYYNEDSTLIISPVTIKELGPPPTIAESQKLRIEQFEVCKNTGNYFKQTAPQNDTNYIYINQNGIYRLDTLFVHPVKKNILLFEGNSNAIRKQFKERLPLNKINDSIYLIDMQDELPENIEIFLLDTTISIPIKMISVYTICGEASYVDNGSNIDPCEQITVAIYYCNDDNCDSYEYIDYTVTDYQGGFCFIADQPVILISLWSDNSATTIAYAEDHDLSIGDLLKYYNHTIICRNYGYIDAVIPPEYLRINNLDIAGAYNILNCIRQGCSFLEGNMGLIPPLKNIIVWDVLDNTRTTSSFGGFSVDGIPGIYIASKTGYDLNWDEWDNAVILHEYGHYVMYTYMERPPETGGSWNYLIPQSGKNNLQLSISEGWANLHSALVRNNPIFINTTYNDPQWIVHNYETSVPDPAYYSSSWDYPANPPWQTTPQWEGASVPGSINVALWDLYDVLDDDNYRIGSTIWGHNNDHNSSSYWRGTDAMWDVLTNYDPQPDNPDHDYCWNIYEFIHGWRTFGYPVDSTFVNIYEAHGISVFQPGDANDNDALNILDIVFIINYLYKSGPEPPHMSAADTNVDCLLNILDITYLSNYFYNGGPAPLVGCFNYY